MAEKKTQVEKEVKAPTTEKAKPVSKTAAEKAEKPAAAKKEAAPKAEKPAAAKKAAAPKAEKPAAEKKAAAPKAEKDTKDLAKETAKLAKETAKLAKEMAKLVKDKEPAAEKPAAAKKEAAPKAEKPVAAKKEAAPKAEKPAAEKKAEAPVKEEKKAVAVAPKQEVAAVQKQEIAPAPKAAAPAPKAEAPKAEKPAADKAQKGTAPKTGAAGRPAKKTRMQSMYEEKVVAELQKHFKYKNINQVPRLEKIVINTGLGDIKDNAKSVQLAVEELRQISGQKPITTKAKKSVANFKVREGMNVGAKVTLRGARMYEFADKLINIALPRVRDFRGVSSKSFDGRGNYAMGVKEQLIFPEITYDQIEKIRGFDICFVTTAKTDEEARELLKLLGMPFRA